MKKVIVSTSFRPYAGRLFATCDMKAFSRECERVFGAVIEIETGVKGRIYSAMAKDGHWTCVVYAENAWTMAHELAHAVLYMFERIDVRAESGNGEPFCYLLEQLMLDTKKLYETPKKAKRK